MSNQDFNLSEQFFRVVHLLLKERFSGIRETVCDPDAWRKRLLGLIKANPDITRKELIKLLNRRTHTGDELLQGLEKKRYFVFEPINGSDDETFRLTELGLKEADAGPNFAMAFDVLDSDEKKALSACLERVIKELEKKVEPGGGADRDSENMMDCMGPGRMAGFGWNFRPDDGFCGFRFRNIVGR